MCDGIEIGNVSDTVSSMVKKEGGEFVSDAASL